MDDRSDIDFFASEGQDSCKSIPVQLQGRKFGNLQGNAASKRSPGKRMRPSSASILKQKSQQLEWRRMRSLKLDGAGAAVGGVTEEEVPKSVRFAKRTPDIPKPHDHETPSVTYAF